MSTDPVGRAGPGRRSTGRRASGPRRRVALGVVLSVVAPVVAVGAALLVRPDGVSVVDRSPTARALDASSLVCPGTGDPGDTGDAGDAGDAGDTAVGVASLAAAGSDGAVTAKIGRAHV